jgi:hypothetical protein
MRPALLGLLLILTGCGDSLWADLRGRVGWQVAALNPWGPEEADEAPPAGEALRLRLGGRISHAALVQDRGVQRLWRNGAGVTLATEGGRVTAAVGLWQGVVATRFDGPDPLSDPAALLDRPAPARRLVDLMRDSREPGGMRFGVAVECLLRAARSEPATVLLVEEHCRAAGLGWLENRFTNRFWVAAEGGQVLRAEQWIGPGVPPLLVEFLAEEGG